MALGQQRLAASEPKASGCDAAAAAAAAAAVGTVLERRSGKLKEGGRGREGALCLGWGRRIEAAVEEASVAVDWGGRRIEEEARRNEDWGALRTSSWAMMSGAWVVPRWPQCVD